MPQSLAQIYVHIVFSTKERRPFLDDPSLREEMHKILGGICNAHGCPVLRVGGVADHVHILCRLGRTITLAGLVKELKRESSLWIKTKTDAMAEFHWQNGYRRLFHQPRSRPSVERIHRQPRGTSQDRNLPR